MTPNHATMRGAVRIGRNEVEGPRKREQLFCRAMKIRAPSARRPAEEIDQTALGFELIKPEAHPLEVHSTT